jgi:hypothetical protein
MDRMVESHAYEPDEDDILVHGYDGRDSYVSVGFNYGRGRPHYFVYLDVNGGEQSWWLDPEHAEQLGDELSRLGARCRQLNIEAGQQGAELTDNGPTSS